MTLILAFYDSDSWFSETQDVKGLITQITLRILSRMTNYGTICIVHILSSSRL